MRYDVRDIIKLQLKVKVYSDEDAVTVKITEVTDEYKAVILEKKNKGLTMRFKEEQIDFSNSYRLIHEDTSRSEKIIHADSPIIQDIPPELKTSVRFVAGIIDKEYGKDRDIDGGSGGYSMILYDPEAQDALMSIYIDPGEAIPEFVDEIHCSNGEIWLSILLILNNDFAVNLFIQKKYANNNFINYIE